MHALFIARRVGVFILIAWLAASLNFLLPKLSGQDPVRTKLLQSAQLGGHVQSGIEEMVREYEKIFGLDQPLWTQYRSFLGRTLRGDFNYSIANYPRTVVEMIAEAVPRTIGLLGATTLPATATSDGAATTTVAAVAGTLPEDSTTTAPSHTSPPVAANTALQPRRGLWVQNAALTPGVIDPNVTQANIGSTICVRGYTKTVRHVTTDRKSTRLNSSHT